MSTISAGTNVNTSLNYSADTTGNLVFQSGSSANTALTLDSTQNATFTGNVSVKTPTGSYTDVAKGVAKAWVNFNASSGATSIRSSFNVSSVTYNSTGLYTVNFTTAFTSTNYATIANAGTGRTGATSEIISVYTPTNSSYGSKTTSACQFGVYCPNAADFNPYDVSIAFFSS
jgi:hypothetical protein